MLALCAASFATITPTVLEVHRIQGLIANAATADIVEATPNGLIMPKVWGAAIVQTTIINGQPAGIGSGGSGQMASDLTLKRSLTLSAFKVPYAPKEFIGTPLEWLNTTSYLVGNFSGIEIENTKYPGSFGGPAGFYDLFSWTPAAKKYGTETINGTSYDIWAFSPAPAYSFALLAKADGTPFIVQQNVSTVRPGSSVPVTYNVTMEFSKWQPSVTPDWAQRLWSGFNESEFTHPAVCADPPSGLTPTAQEAYIFHPRHEFNISQQDNGDVDGDVYFVCEDLLTNSSKAQGEDYQWITHWTIDLIPKWGQYQNCNNYGASNLCLGVEHFWVGHEAALGMGAPDGGQCVTNPLTGEWFSLPEGGKCAVGQAPDGKTCTWSAKRVKTIDAQCMLKHGYINACKAGGRAPFPAAKAIFLAAFASDDPAKGGCPALPGP